MGAVEQTLEIQVLGDLSVFRAGTRVPVTAPMQRKLLALLLTNLNRPVSLDRAAEVLYGSTQPGNPARALRFHVSRLRGALEPDVPATQRTGIVRTTPNGYQLEVNPHSIDAHRFVTLANHARTVFASEPREAATVAADAFALWSGDPLAEFEYDDFAQPLRTELAERKLALEEIQIEALLALGDNEGAVALLRPLTGRHPYRESLYALLMTALYRAGRQADALTTYQEARDVLLEDLGVDPGPDLADLEHQILTQAPGLLPTASPGVAHNLPPATSLVGRFEAGRELDRFIRQHRLVQLTGLPGVGKSALALAGAHNLVQSFPDGTVYVRIDAGASTRQIIQELGAGLSTVGAQAVDDGNVVRAIARRNILVLLDDCHRSAKSARSVIDRLLADGDRVSVLATMRTAINGLPGAVLTIDPLDPATDGIQLLDELLGDPGVDERSRDTNFDPEQIARSAGGLPGSLEIAATAIRVGGLGDPSLRPFDEAILEATTAGLVEEIAAELPPTVMGLARRLASFPEGLPIDEIFQIIDPDSSPLTVLDNLSILTSTGVAVAEGSRYRIAPVLSNPFDRTLPDDERHKVFQRAASGFSRSPGARISSNAAGVVRGLLLAGDIAAAMHLIARAGAVWWQGPDRAQFADLCRAALVSRDPPIGRDLEATLFFATHASLDLGDESTALAYAARYAEVASRLDDRVVEMHAQQLRGNIDAYSGTLLDARSAYTDALKIGRRIGHPEVTWIAASRATMDILLGDPDAAEAGADQVAAEATVRGQQRGIALAAGLRGSAGFHRGNTDAAIDEFRNACDIAAVCGAAREQVLALQRLADAHVSVGASTDATRALTDAEQLAAASGLPAPPYLTATAAIVASDAGHVADAALRLAHLRGSLRYRRPAVWIHRGLLAAAVVAAAAGRDEDALLRLAVLVDLGIRTGLTLPVPWQERVHRIRETASDAATKADLGRARSSDPVELIS